MNNVHALRTGARRHDEASAWIARLDKGLSERDIVAVRQWMAADEDNAVVLLQMAALWDRMDTLSRLADVVPRSAPKVVRHARVWMAAAAAVLVAVLVGLWGLGTTVWRDGSHGRAEDIVTTDPTTYETPVGAQSTVKLSDGTRIILNTDTRIRVRYTAHRRLLLMDRGEIHVDVAHDRSRPLSVVAGNRVIQAVGTAFTVKIDSAQQIDVVVTDGRVRVGVRPTRATESSTAPPELLSDASLSVAQGEEVMLGSPNEAVKTLTPEDIRVRLSWRDGNLIFRGEALVDAVDEISRYTPVEFVFMTNDLEKVRIAGLFKAGDVEGFLAALRANFGIEFERIDNKKILLKPDSSSAH